MIAHRRADVADLNRRARERMRAAGRLGADELDLASAPSPSATASSRRATTAGSASSTATPARSTADRPTAR